MSPAQNNLYWGKWNAVKKALITLGSYEKTEAEAKRHEIHVEALGKDKSHLDFTNRDLDRVLDAFDAYIIGQPARNRAVEQPLNRAIKGIIQTGLPEPYIASIAFDKFEGCTDWRTLTESSLRQLKMTLDRRAKAKAVHA